MHVSGQIFESFLQVSLRWREQDESFFEQAKLFAWLLDTKGQTLPSKGNYFYQTNFVWSAAQLGKLLEGKGADRQVLSEESDNENRQ